MERNKNLRDYNSFGLAANAAFFAPFKDNAGLKSILTAFRKENPGLPVMILGGGSNLLFANDYEGLILKNSSRGIDCIAADNDAYFISVKGGESWHGLVMHCLQNEWYGLENLSLIPGLAGASPIQNIGAYGVEIKDFFYSLKAWHLQEEKEYIFNKADCQFDYRHSIFKKEYKGEFAIMEITFRLPKKWIPQTNYGAIRQELDALKIKEPTPAQVSEAVIRIRKSKLPDPKEIGNAGSFFKNPLVPYAHYRQLQATAEAIPSYPATDGFVKIPAAWLIEQCGWKGYRDGDAGVHAQQALVLVNHGKAKGRELLELATAIQQSVQEKFAISLEMEVNVI